MIESAIATRLTNATAAASRVYPVVAPQDSATYPYLVYERISTVRPHSMAVRASGLAGVRIQVRAWAKTYKEVRSIAEEVRNRLDGFSGSIVVGATTFDVQAILTQDERDDYDPAERLFSSSVDFVVWFAENVPTG